MLLQVVTGHELADTNRIVVLSSGECGSDEADLAPVTERLGSEEVQNTGRFWLFTIWLLAMPFFLLYTDSKWLTRSG